MNKVSPSILSADFANLLSDIIKVENADWIHVDVMDGHFVPNISIGMPVVASLRKATDMFLDVHLMISDPLKYAVEFAKAGADLICFHYESDSPVLETIEAIKSCGKKVGIAIKPNTPATVVEEYLDKVDMILVMTVEPGFGGQGFMHDMLIKIEQVRKMAIEINPQLLIQVDGGINLETAKLTAASGADVLVAGSFIYNNENPKEVIEQLKLA